MIQYQTEEVCVFESALFRTTSTVFHNPDMIVIVDPTWLPGEVKAIRQYVDSVKSGQPVYLLFTHSDYDHIIAYAAFPEAQVIASGAFVDNPQRESILRQIREFDESYYVQRDYPIEYPEVNVVVEKDGQELQVGQSTLTFYLAPGHNADGLFAVLEPAGIWWPGDYLSNIEFPYLYHSYRDYLGTLAKIDLMVEAHSFSLLVPGHGDVGRTLAELQQRKSESLHYLEQLYRSVVHQSAFDLEALWQRYDFPHGMLPFHQGNIALVKKELNL